MAGWLIHDGTVILNAIVADSQEIAEEVTGLHAMPAPQGANPWIGWTLVNGEWVAPQPHPSWTLDANHDWQPPTPMPSEGGPWVWDEDTLSWVEVTA